MENYFGPGIDGSSNVRFVDDRFEIVDHIDKVWTLLV